MGLLLTLHIIVSILLIVTILLQVGKGATTGASFGGGVRTFFGVMGAISPLAKVIIVLAIIFMTTTLFMSVFYAGSKPPQIEPEIETSMVDKKSLLVASYWLLEEGKNRT